ncbi:MAG: hypothetical protein A2729_01955 [Candidatus Buchananbacteria bacterium RIFCSPHIGHO2_01_FULL_39_14]|uniref:Aminoglycoside phosphotransferase domain-containing protein n=2 Tax=Candidatus Buchananiibacteriota TaxID=1817903 RepID=A0A1G1YUY1_9BACT|nr:MAG: hypothetical protein A2729_01955 [Candidatus Buchananbacteria bacterium RIFCSPHIGHO2_01_FULL_39_14]OGY48082.1 MAG: hypothetical protein A3D39_02215 [Candidatus Buchananbacteria bacterium RIFCSPHIGHO2_02_FULL_39_17]OGY55576.1 MAG: hypothetical protein A2912_02435 [Candidatus Buchananbacteria bacterium RIFCSPLOWO2_01_FULL_40_23b]
MPKYNQAALETLLSGIASQYLSREVVLVWFSRSHFSSLACFRLVDQATKPGVVVKTIMPWYLDQLDTVQRGEVAKLWIEATMHFRNLLTQHGVPVAKDYRCFCQDGYVYHLSSEEGRSGEEFVQSLSPVARAQAIRLILEAITGVLRQQNSPLVGLDPQLSNFGFRQTPLGLKVSYLDVFPPLCWFQGRYLVHYPNPTDSGIIESELNRKFRLLGILRRMRFSIMAIDLGLEEIFFNELSAVLGNSLLAETMGFFNSLPDASVKNSFDHAAVKDSILRLQPDGQGIDAIREFGVRLASRYTERSRTDFLADVFDLSRKDQSPGFEEPHLVRFEKLQKRLVSLL